MVNEPSFSKIRICGGRSFRHLKKSNHLWDEKKPFFFHIFFSLLQLTHCLLNRLQVAPDKLNHALAAYCAGLSHFFYPEMTLFHFAVVQAVLMLWRMFQIYGAGTENKISRALLDFPYTYVLYPLIQAHCVHIHIMRPQLCGKLHLATDNSFTNN